MVLLLHLLHLRPVLHHLHRRLLDLLHQLVHLAKRVDRHKPLQLRQVMQLTQVTITVNITLTMASINTTRIITTTTTDTIIVLPLRQSIRLLQVAQMIVRLLRRLLVTMQLLKQSSLLQTRTITPFLLLRKSSKLVIKNGEDKDNECVGLLTFPRDILFAD